MVQAVDDTAAYRVDRQKRRRIRAVSTLSVIRSHDQKTVAYASARPIEPAVCSIDPGCELLLVRSCGVLVCYGDTDPIRRLGLPAPEASIDIAVSIGDRRIRLTAERILVDPDRFQRRRIERLDDTVRKCDEQHPLRIGRRRDVERRLLDHRAGLLDLARCCIDLKDVLFCCADEIPVNEDRRADGVRAIADTGLICPIQNGVRGGHGRALFRYGVVIFIPAKIVPLGGNLLPQGFVLFGRFKRNVQPHCRHIRIKRSALGYEPVF